MDDEDELAESIRAGDLGDGDRGDEAPAPIPRRPRKKERSTVGAVLLIAGVLTLLGAGVGVLLFGTSASDAFVYSKLVDEVMAAPETFHDRELRVEGQLRQGSVEFQAEPTCEHRFTLTRGTYEMPVRFPRCVVPDTFRDDMPMDVVVQGRLQTNGTFLANEVIPRCPSKYEMRERQQGGEEMPHAMPTAS